MWSAENRGLYYGASITGAEGGVVSTNQAECREGIVVVGKDNEFEVAKVNKTGAVEMAARARHAKVTVRELGSRGVEVVDRSEPDYVLSPGESRNVRIGSAEVRIEANPDTGITYNGAVPTVWIKELEHVMYSNDRGLLTLLMLS